MTNNSTTKTAIAFIIISIVLTACNALDGRNPESQLPNSLLNFEDCQIGEGNLRTSARCTTLEVLEDRSSPEGRIIKLFIAIIPATSRNPAPDPLFFLAGGPGEAATQAYATLSGAFAYINLKRDIVLVDQRGTGQSNPLTCKDEVNGEPATDPDHGLKDTIQQCLQGLDADPRFYTTAIAMDDLDQVRVALGYERINLYGASYGTRAALVYARQYPAHLRSMILDGIAPVGWLLGPDGSLYAQRALDLIFERCAETQTCSDAFPNLSADFQTVISNLKAHPTVVEYADPNSGEIITSTLTAEIVAMTLHALSYVPEGAALIPVLIHQASSGNLTPLTAISLEYGNDLSNSVNSGMYLSVVCSEDVPFYPERLSNEGYLGTASTERLIDTCTLWPHQDVTANFIEPVHSNVPTLILSGEVDPVTPPQNGELALKTLTNARHLILPDHGHISILRGCIPILARNFIETASIKELNAECVDKLTPISFFINPNGPVP